MSFVHANAQTSNFLVCGNDKFSANFDKNGKFIINQTYSKPNDYLSNSICNSKGFPQLFNVYSTGSKSFIQDSRGNILPNGANKYSLNENYFFNFSNGSYIFLYAKDSSGTKENQGFITNILRPTDGLFMSKIASNGQNFIITKANLQLLNKNILNISACRKNDSSYLVICNTTEKLYSLMIYWNKFELIDSIDIKRNSCLPDSILKNTSIKTIFSSEIYLSHNGLSLIFCEQSNAFYSVSTGGIFASKLFGSGGSIIDEIGIDNNGNFLSRRKIDATYLTANESDGLRGITFVFSPNSRKIYGMKSSDSLSITSYYDKYDIFQYDLTDPYPNLTKKLIYTRATPKSQGDTLIYISPLPKLNYLGQYVFILNHTIKSQSNKSFISLNKIKSPNEKFPALDFVRNEQYLSLFGFGSSFSLSLFSKQIYDYLRIEYLEIPNLKCQSEIAFKNNSDTSGGLYKYLFIVEKSQNNFDTVESFEPKFIFEKNGRYPYKVVGFGKNNYTEVFIDTINIKLVKQPEILQLNVPKSVCRFQEFKVSSIINANSNNSSLYAWNYTLGKSGLIHSKELLHLFDDTGLFRVRLMFSNGYCEDTLDEFVKVIDAPKPGFNADITRGCAPLKIRLMDTVTLNVIKKEYWISDSSYWHQFSTKALSVNHLFKNAGRFKIVQKLTGSTGCITQEDTIEIIVSKGLTELDTFDIINCSILNEDVYSDSKIIINNILNQPLLYWKRNPSVVQYDIIKDGVYYLSTTDTFLIEKWFNRITQYEVIGRDSCGNKGKIGAVGQPVLLEVTMDGYNKSALINFSNYLKWKNVKEVQYSIQKYSEGKWHTIFSEKSSKNLNDLDFLNNSEQYACYRVEARNKIDTNIVSFSNIVCIPYIPTIFIPNAFSPNGDGINDVFELTFYGIEYYELTVVNRWGEIIFKGKKNESWKGLDAPDGVYTILIKYKTNNGSILNQKTNIHLLK